MHSFSGIQIKSNNKQSQRRVVIIKNVYVCVFERVCACVCVSVHIFLYARIYTYMHVLSACIT